MKTTLRSTARVVAAAVAIGGIFAATTAPALATVPPYEPDSANEFGSIAFYDSTGQPVTSGNTSDAPFALYAVASTDDPTATDTKATLYAAKPVEGQNPGLWSSEQTSSSTTFPNTGAGVPSVVANAGDHRPVVSLSASDLTIADMATDLNNTSGTYANIYQLRILTGPTGNAKYWAADVQITGTTWQLIYPSPTPPPSGTVTLTGTHRVNYTNTCNKSFTNATSYAYKWFASGVQISGATASTYKISEKYYKKTLKCEVDATGPSGTTAVRSAGYLVGIGPKLVMKTKPYVYRKTSSGKNRTSAKRGVREYCYHGTWSPAAKSYQYRWFRGTTRISGATGASYVPIRADVGHRISCRVTAIRYAWTSALYRTAAVPVKS